jgi:HEAT repeat protein
MLENALGSENELIQTIAISALGELGDKRALPLLLPYASNADWQIRYRVAQALGRLGGVEADAALEILAKDEVEQVSQEAKVGQDNILKL